MNATIPAATNADKKNLRICMDRSLLIAKGWSENRERCIPGIAHSASHIGGSEPDLNLAGNAPGPGKKIPRRFFSQQPDVVARALLGKLLVRRDADGALRAGRVVETEAYFGEGDAAAHAFRGRTPRTEVLFGPPGHAYVYFIYGMHFCLNVSCETEGRAGSVLLRALEPIAGIDRMRASRGLDERASLKQISGGPARLCEAMEITRDRDNGKDMVAASGDLVWRDDGFPVSGIACTPRIGISQATEMLLRYSLRGHACVSR